MIQKINLATYIKNLKKTLEIGPFKSPIRNDLVFLDRFLSKEQYRGVSDIKDPDHSVVQFGGVQGDAFKMPFRDDCFETIFLSYFPFGKRFLELLTECRRVLESKGKILVLTSKIYNDIMVNNNCKEILDYDKSILCFFNKE